MGRFIFADAKEVDRINEENKLLERMAEEARYNTAIINDISDIIDEIGDRDITEDDLARVTALTRKLK